MLDDSYLSKLAADLSSLGFITGTVTARIPTPLPGYDALSLEFVVAEPTSGIANGIRSTEPVLLLIPSGSNPMPPIALATREGFPVLTHAEQTELGVALCLTRLNSKDWWVGKTSRDLAITVKEWLDDAAADLLVKHDDPFEPLILQDSTSLIELDLAGPLLSEVRRRGWLPANAKEFDLGRRNRVLVGTSGDIPCLLLYQRIRQVLGWQRPADFDFLSQHLQMFGFDLEPLHRFEKHMGPRGFLIVGVKRGREVLGVASHPEEWIAFELLRERLKEGAGRKGKKPWGQCEIRPHKMRFSYNPLLARRLSGWKEDAQPRKAVLIGAGALGSFIGAGLGRSGLVQLHIVDPDILEPHNLPRHALSELFVGIPKGPGLAMALQPLLASAGHAGYAEDILPSTPEGLNRLLEDAVCIIDATASPAIQRYLADLPQPRPPLCCTFQVASGSGTVILAEGTSFGPPVDVMEVLLAYSERKATVLRKWFQESTEPVQIGAGCRSPSARIPGTIVEIGASWAAHAISLWISNGKWPQNANFGLGSMSSDSQDRPSFSSQWLPLGVEPLLTASDWRVWLSNAAVSKIKALVLSSSPKETGGVLIGESDRRRKVFYVVDAWPAPADSVSSQACFVRGHRGLRTRLVLLTRTTRRFGYVGEWHSHPFGSTGLSARDVATSKEIAQRLAAAELPALCLVSNGAAYDVHVIQ